MLSKQIYSRLLKNGKPIQLFSKAFASNEMETTRIEKTINQVTLLGRAGAEPQKKGNADHPLVVFSLATHTNYRYESGETMQRVEWHRVCIFKPGLRETVYNYLKKGQRVYVSGRISYGEVKTESGTSKPTTAIIADDVIFFQSPDNSQK